MSENREQEMGEVMDREQRELSESASVIAAVMKSLFDRDEWRASQEEMAELRRAREEHQEYVARLLAETDPGLQGAARRARAVELLREGVKQGVIADRFGVHFTLVYRWAKEEGLSRRWREVEGHLAAPTTPNARHEEYRQRAVKAVQMIKEGRRLEDVAEELGVVGYTVRRWISAHERETGEKVELVKAAHRGRRPKVEDGQAKAVRMRKEGMSAAEVARKLGVDVSHVHSWIRKYNAQEGVEPIKRQRKKARGVAEEQEQA